MHMLQTLKNAHALIDSATLNLTFEPQNITTASRDPKIIPYTKFEHLGLFVFELNAARGQTNRQTATDRQTDSKSLLTLRR